jgi:light-regulated signal transduction histidine kinase (bacteriophytochrome)
MSEKYNPLLFAEFFDWQPQAYVWLQPVWDRERKNIVDFKYVYSNQLGLDYLKLSREMLGNIAISNTPSLTDEMRPRILKEMLDAYHSGETVSVDMYNPIINKYATVYRLRFRGGILTTIHDKTEEKLAILELSKTTRELHQLNEGLKEFAYAASHDLQEPLRKVTAFISILKAELPALNRSQQTTINKLEFAALRMKVLINDLLAYSLLSAKPESFKTVDLNEVLNQVLQDLDSAIIEAGVKITTTSLPKIKGDERQMLQLFQNLLSNAIKYRTKLGTPRVTIHCRTINEGDPIRTSFPQLEKKDYYLIEVIDNGIGFDQQYSERIFQVFERLHGREEYEGTGIGLSIVQKVASHHHGFVKANSVLGKGATFQVFLPF